jgi:phage shock protein PspC (stress-responsive transcriptional regulator)
VGFDLGAMHVELPAVISIAFVGALVAFAIWAILSWVAAPAPSRDEQRDDLYPRRLDRSRRRAIGGVCAGIARYFGWQVGTTRAAFVFMAIFSAGFTAVLFYLVLWRVMPLEEFKLAPEFSLDEYRVD